MIGIIAEEHRENDQIFSYWHERKLLHFNVTLMARVRKIASKQFRRITLDLEEQIYDLCMTHRGIEENKVRALTAKDLREPGYGVMLDGQGTFTVVDGHHRLVRRWRGGVRTMDFWVSTKFIWEQCLVHYPPEFEAILAADIPPMQANPGLIASAVRLHAEEDE